MAKRTVHFGSDTRTGFDVVNQHREDSDAQLVRIPLDEIGDRPAGDTRPINEAQVASLVESIAVVGLICPLAVDCENRLLAGGHRRAALKALREQDEPRFNDLFKAGVPCRKFDFDSTTDHEQALQVEVAENEKRRNYTRAEIRAVAERLKQQGYSLAKGRGNKQPLHPALQVAFGVSRNTVIRALKEDESNVPRGTFDSEPKTRSIALPSALAFLIKDMAIYRGETVPELLTKALDALVQQAH